MVAKLTSGERDARILSKILNGHRKDEISKRGRYCKTCSAQQQRAYPQRKKDDA